MALSAKLMNQVRERNDNQLISKGVIRTMEFTNRLMLISMVLILVTAMSGCFATDNSPATGGPEGEEGVEDEENGTANETQGPLVEASVSWNFGGSGCAAIGGVFLFAAALEGVDHAEISIDSDAGGNPYEANLEADVPTSQWGVSFWGGDDLIDFDSTPEDSLSGTVPGQADRVILWSCGGGMVQVEFVVTLEEK